MLGCSSFLLGFQALALGVRVLWWVVQTIGLGVVSCVHLVCCISTRLRARRVWDR